MRTIWEKMNLQGYRTDPYVHSSNEHIQRFEDITSNETTYSSKAARIGFYTFVTIGAGISFVSLIPYVLLSNDYNAFPGSAEFVGQAVFLDFGIFGSWGYYQLGKLMFQKQSDGQIDTHTKRQQKKAMIVAYFIAALVCGLCSRLPSAGEALQVAPNISPHWRIFWAGLGLLGTAGPEILSMYRVVSKVQLCCQSDQSISKEHQKTFQTVKKNLIDSLDEWKQETLYEYDQHTTLELKNHPLPNITQNIEDIRKSSISTSCAPLTWTKRVCVGLITTYSTTAMLLLNTIFTKFAIDYFFLNQA